MNKKDVYRLYSLKDFFFFDRSLVASQVSLFTALNVGWSMLFFCRKVHGVSFNCEKTEED